MRRLISLVLLTAGIGLWAETLSELLVPLREAIYEQQLSVNEIRPLYLAAKAEIERRYTGDALDLALSRNEFFMGRALLFEERSEEARTHFAEGLRLAERATQTRASAEAWVLQAENLAFLCQIGPWTFTVANGLNVERFAKNALALNSRNAAAQYLIAARWIFAPAPFHNHRKGIEMMQEILTNSDMEKDDRFNVYSAIGYGFIQQRKFDDARPWVLRALEVYPTSTFAAELLSNVNNRSRN